MLITRRKQGEALLIGDNIEVLVLEVAQGRVKLGVSAPTDVSVERKEWRLVKDQNRNASVATESAFVQSILGAGLAINCGNTGGLVSGEESRSPVNPHTGIPSTADE